MQTVANIAQRLVSPSGSPKPTAQTQAGPAVEHSTDDEILAIWQRMGSIYGHKWTSSYGEKVDATWRKALKSLPVDRLKMALARCAKRGDAWPPSLPEFMALAAVIPEEVRAPAVEQAFTEALRGAYPYANHHWSHKCVYWAAARTGMDFLIERQQGARTLFEREYQDAIEKADQLDEPPRFALVKGTQRARDAEMEEAAEEGIAACRAILGDA